MLGVDTAALDAQLAARRDAEARERARETEWARYNSAVAEHLEEQDKLERAVRRDVATAVREFNVAQKPQARREFDLSAEACKADAPLRIGDHDPRLGPSSGQVFAGEDLEAARRLELQRAQQLRFVREQISAKETAAAAMKEEQDFAAARAEAARQAMIAAEQEHEAARKEQARLTREANEDLARATAARAQADKEHEAALAAAAVEAAIDSDFLNERHSVTVSAVNPTRFIPANFKGFTDSEVAAIRQSQLEQAEARRKAEAANAAHEAAWAEAQAAQRRQLELMERAHERDVHAVRAELAETLTVMTAEQRTAEQKRQKDIYANRISEDFFAGFGQSSR
eukprot:gnl/Ergobibamus_cyprinoides/494.p1 GENE.gnl/Ergobibamus_cyprinoides/494~~gnl/Ergobibamus_cyprinoides/494.p1  ORF type:complete len:372 (+),score=129.00 gnl/Ergobibamus_cyprinoides/494:93-1118(+)